MGYNVGKSLVEEDMVELASTLMKKAEEKGVKLILPTDVVLADKFDNDANTAIASKYDDIGITNALCSRTFLTFSDRQYRGQRNRW